VGAANSDINAMPAFLQNAIYDSLLRPNPATGALEPSLAESYQVSNDGLQITFQLRRGVRWHTGEQLTAEDVVATLNAFSSSDFRGTAVTDFGTLQRVTAADDRTVQLSFREAYCPALTYIGTLKIVPRRVANSADFPRLKPENLVGTGPLKLQAANGDKYVLARNGEYFAGAPHIQTWTLQFYRDIATLRSAFNARQIDMMLGSPRDTALTRQLTVSDALLVPAAVPEIISLLFNTDHIALHDTRVRQALSYALDRTVLLNDLAGNAAPVDGIALPGYWAAPAALPRYALDLNRARALLAEAGWRDSGDGVLRKDNRPLSVELWTEADDPLLEPLAFRIREMYAALGLQVVLQLDDRPGWITHAFDHRFDLLLLSRKIPLDPDQRWYWQTDQNGKDSGCNFGSFSNAQVDALFRETLRAGGCAAAGRATLFGELERNLLADPPAAFLFAPKQYLVLQSRVLGPAPSSFAGAFWNLKDWAVK
jgi:peptide/nickel transport system substrate-binding protein